MKRLPEDERDPHVEIDPLPERRWAEIRRRTLALAQLMPASGSMPPPARARLRRWQGATAIAVAAACVLAWVAAVGMPGTVQHVSTSRVVTTTSPTTATAGDVTIELASHSSVIVLQEDRDAWLVEIEHGSARFLVPPRGSLPPFRVEAGETQVVVIGTRFVVARSAGAASGEVLVEHGAVRVIEHGEERVLHDGERWPAAVTTATAAPVLRPSEAHPAVAPAADALAAPVVARAPRPAVTSREPPVQGTPPVAPVEAPPPPAEPTPDTTAATSAPPAPPLAVPIEPPPPDARARYAEAVALEANDPARAVALYDALSNEGGSWGATALFAEARLEVERQHASHARQLLERYLAEHPGGVNADDAQRLLSQLR